MKVYLESNGCIRRNSEIVKLKTYFNANHVKILNRPKKADYIILSTCALKEEDEDHSISRIRFLNKFGGKLLVLGCLPDIAPSRFSEFTGTSSIPPREIEKIDTYFTGNKIKFSEIENTNTIPKKISVSSFTTALQKLKQDFEFSTAFRLRILRYLDKTIQVLLRKNAHNFYLSISRGCLGRCSYCAIRRAIGPLVSQPVDRIIKQFHQGLAKGYKDFVILGDDVGAYGIDTGQNFAQLMARLISELDTINKNMPEKNKRLADVKFHIQEIHPHWLIKFRQELLELMKSKRIKSILCPIESGNDRILGLMNRRYNVDEISAFFKEARSIYPDILYSTHLMVGFPSETEEEFEDSLNAIVKIHFAHVTVFPYDQKEGTPASEITPQIDKLTINKRLDKTRKFLKHAGIKTYLSCPE